jgi:hypothetical protein
MLVPYELAGKVESKSELDGLESTGVCLTVRDIDQRELADALMACAFAVAAPDEVATLKAGYALALERERATSTR